MVVSTPEPGCRFRPARPQAAGHQAARHVLDEDEIAAGDAAVLHRQRLAMQRLPDERRRHVAPDCRRRAAPSAGAEDLAWTVDVLEAGLDERHLVAGEIVIAVHLADELGDRVRAVVEQRDGRVLRVAVAPSKVFSATAQPAAEVDDFLQALDVFQPLEQLEVVSVLLS